MKYILQRLFGQLAWWQFVFCVFIGGLFVFAGISKLSDLPSFTKEINNYRILPASWAPYVAAILPWLEILTGVGLLFQPFRLASAGIITGLMTTFTAAVCLALARGLDISCGCFGKVFEDYGSSLSGALVRDLIILLGVMVIFRITWRQETVVTDVNGTEGFSRLGEENVELDEGESEQALPIPKKISIQP